MDDFDKYLKKQMDDPEFKKEWDNSELAERTGLRQSNISRIEKGQAMPSIKTLSKIAHGLGKQLQIKFV